MAPERRNSDLAMLTRSVRIHTLPPRPPYDVWAFDAPFYKVGERGSYDHYFQSLLEGQGFSTFQELLAARKKANLPTDTLDAFGSGYFLDDLTIPKSITGARLKDSSAEVLRQLRDHQANKRGNVEQLEIAISKISAVTASPNWSLVEGNLFLPSGWSAIDQNARERDITKYGLIVGKPDGAFKNEFILEIEDAFADPNTKKPRDRVYSHKFLRLLSRAYTRLSSHKGMIFTEFPEWIANKHLDSFINLLTTKGNIYTVIEDNEFYSGRKNFFLEKNQGSVSDLEKLVLEHFKLV